MVGEEHFPQDYDTDQVVLRVCPIQIRDECFWDRLTQLFNGFSYGGIGIHDTDVKFHSPAYGLFWIPRVHFPLFEFLWSRCGIQDKRNRENNGQNLVLQN